MMPVGLILGIGTDLCDIRRIERSLAQFGQRFKDRAFTVEEQERAERSRNPASSYAKRFAAKEAAAKALGTGIAEGVALKDIAVVNAANGRPSLVLTGGAAARVQAMLPPGCVADLHLSLSDDYPLAQAFVIIAARSVSGQ
jgi:holo-[acyl-carrier protein] synthase